MLILGLSGWERRGAIWSITASSASSPEEDGGSGGGGGGGVSRTMSSMTWSASLDLGGDASIVVLMVHSDLQSSERNDVESKVGFAEEEGEGWRTGLKLVWEWQRNGQRQVGAPNNEWRFLFFCFAQNENGEWVVFFLPHKFFHCEFNNYDSFFWTIIVADSSLYLYLTENNDLQCVWRTGG